MFRLDYFIDNMLEKINNIELLLDKKDVLQKLNYKKRI